MGRTRVGAAQEGFGGGLNTRADDLQMAANECRDTTNMRLTSLGAAVKRGGTRRLHATALPGPVLGGAEFQNGSALEQLVIANGALYRGTYGIPMTWAVVLGATFSTTILPSMVSFRDGSTNVLYIADGGTGIAKYDGTTLSRVATSISGVRKLVVYNQRLHGWRTTDEATLWSGINNGDTLGVAPNGGLAIVRTYGDRAIVSGGTAGGSLVLFHESGASVFTGLSQDDINIQAGTQGLTQQNGTLSPSSVVSVDGVAYYLSDRGVFAATAGGVTSVSEKVEPTWLGMDRAVWRNVVGAYNPVGDELWYLVPGVGVYVFNRRLGAWTGPWVDGFNAPQVQALWQASDASGRPIMLCGDAGGWVRLCDAPRILDNVLANDTGGDNITMILRSRRMFPGGIADEVSLRWLYMVANTRGSADTRIQVSTRRLTYEFAVSAVPGAWGAGTWGAGTWGSGTLDRTRLPISGRGPWVDLYLVDSGSTQTSISRLDIEAFTMGRRD